MPESQREITATRIALLDLKDEQQLVREGYELLDEKRILLATEMQRQLAQTRRAAAGMCRTHARAALANCWPRWTDTASMSCRCIRRSR